MSILRYERVTTTAFALTEIQQRALIEYGWKGVRLLESGKGDKTSWFDTTARLRFGLEMSNRYYETVTSLGMKLGYDSAVDVMLRAQSKSFEVWTITSGELDNIKAALEAIDTMQRVHTRRDMAPVLRQAVIHTAAKFGNDFKVTQIAPKHPNKTMRKKNR